MFWTSDDSQHAAQTQLTRETADAFALRPAAAALAIGFAAMLLADTANAGSQCANKIVGGGKVAEIVDAATLRLDDGSLVRLMGALPPEAPAWWKEERPWPPSAASHDALRSMTAGRTVELRTAEGETLRDRHGRLLAQTFAVDGAEPVWVQGAMVERGFSRAYSLAGHAACARALQKHERKARRARAGLWGKRSFTAFDAAAVDALLKRRNRFHVVEGRVHSVGHTRKWSFVNFTDDWKTDFTIAVASAHRKRFEGKETNLQSLKGKRVRVRGWVERWNGPVIKATHPEQLEIIQ